MHILSPHLAKKVFWVFAQDPDHSDLFGFESGILMHTESAKLGCGPSIQSQVLECTVVAQPSSNFWI